MTETTPKQSNRPLVTIGLPVYNEEHYLSQALDSLLSQDYDNFELVIVDNASTDATPRICQEYAAQDKRIRYYRNNKNIGGIRNFNKVFKLARGEYFTWASGHDLRHPSYISRCIEAFEEDSFVVLCHTQTVWIDAEGQQLEVVPGSVETRGLNERMLRFNVVLWGLVTGFPIYGLIRASALRSTRGYSLVWSPDITLLVELSLLGTFAHIREPLLMARRPPDYGDWDTYLEKHFTNRLTERSAQILFWRMIVELMRRVNRHTRSPVGKTIGFLSVIGCMLTKYRWVLMALLSLKKKS